MTSEELLKLIAKAAKKHSTQLAHSSKGLTSLPPEIGELKNLTISSNSSLPAAAAKPCSLRLNPHTLTG